MIARRYCRRSRGADQPIDDRGSLPLAMLVILLITLLSAAALPVLFSLAGSTRSDASRVTALNAAETGLQVAIGQIRSARDSVGAGSDSQLPCGTSLSGRVTGSTGAQYSVAVLYFDTDPRAMSAAAQSAARITCAALPTHTPSFVGLTSTGTMNASLTDPGARILTGTYQVSTNNQNIPGGLIQNSNDGASTYLNLCMDAGSSSPPAGTVLFVQPCQSNVPDQQRFSYRNNLSLVLNSSVTSSGSGMCLQADPSAALSAGLAIVFEPCLNSGDSTLYLQQWSFNDGSLFQSATSAGALGSYCFNISALDQGNVPVALGGCSGTTRQVSWIPSPAVGAGMAGPGTNQLVNFKQFGRCLDLANWTLTAATIAFPCKQTPSGMPGWNQRWSYNSSTHTISMNYDSGSHIVGKATAPYCLIVPNPGASGAALRAYALPCPDPSTPTPISMQWTGHTASTDLYKDKFTFSDSYGRCLTPSASDFYSLAGNAANNISWVAVAPCDGSLLQKWNADPTVLLSSPLKDANEPR